MARRNAGGTPATQELVRAGIVFTEHRYAHDPSARSYGLEAAQALEVDPSRVYKTLIVEADGALAVGIVPVDMSLDLKAIAAALGAKRARMADVEDAERATGYVVGGISPVGGRRRLPTVLDASAQRHSTIFVSGGRRGFDIELSPADLTTVTAATLAAIAKP